MTTRADEAGKAWGSAADTREWYHRPPSHHAIAHAAIPTTT
jgi:hypothetical protein